jgi:hypothetical protein
MLKNNLDLNVWDKLGYETDYKREGWVITPYTITKEGDHFGTGKELPNIKLSKQDALRLTLGKRKSEGGDYTEDADFWIDMQGFHVAYRDIPRRITRKLKEALDDVAEDN